MMLWRPSEGENMAQENPEFGIIWPGCGRPRRLSGKPEMRQSEEVDQFDASSGL